MFFVVALLFSRTLTCQVEFAADHLIETVYVYSWELAYHTFKKREKQSSSHLARGPVQFHRVYQVLSVKHYGKLQVRCTSSVRTGWRKWLFLVLSNTKATDDHATLLDTLSLKLSLSPLTSFSRNTRLNSAKRVASYEAL